MTSAGGRQTMLALLADTGWTQVLAALSFVAAIAATMATVYGRRKDAEAKARELARIEQAAVAQEDVAKVQLAHTILRDVLTDLKQDNADLRTNETRLEARIVELERQLRAAFVELEQCRAEVARLTRERT